MPISDTATTLSADELIAWEEVHRLVGYCRMQIDRLEKADDFPKRIKLGKGRGGRVMWRRVEISAWIDSRPRGPNGDCR
jgi:predicted DNA-binding transcriptional regulator AlpA